jgi:hypothetical protein
VDQGYSSSCAARRGQNSLRSEIMTSRSRAGGQLQVDLKRRKLHETAGGRAALKRSASRYRHLRASCIAPLMRGWSALSSSHFFVLSRSHISDTRLERQRVSCEDGNRKSLETFTWREWNAGRGLRRGIHDDPKLWWVSIEKSAQHGSKRTKALLSA